MVNSGQVGPGHCVPQRLLGEGFSGLVQDRKENQMASLYVLIPLLYFVLC